MGRLRRYYSFLQPLTWNGHLCFDTTWLCVMSRALKNVTMPPNVGTTSRRSSGGHSYNKNLKIVGGVPHYLPTFGFARTRGQEDGHLVTKNGPGDILAGFQEVIHTIRIWKLSVAYLTIYRLSALHILEGKKMGTWSWKMDLVIFRQGLFGMAD